MNNKLTAKEELFCQQLARGKSEREAAFCAGFGIMPERAALRLLKKPAVREELERCREQVSASPVESGLRRLAFGSVTDAIKLIFCEEPTQLELEGLDLFCVSEIKRPKGGGMEIKFFDRIKALEKLSAVSGEAKKGPLDALCSALERGAKQ